MRLKNININERNSTFTNENQKRSLRDMSSSINQLGVVFDNMVNLESFILKEIQGELSLLLNIRKDREKIINENGVDLYLEEFFKPAVYKIEEKINQVISDWDGTDDRMKTQEIKEVVIIIKEVSQILSKIQIDKFQSLKTLNDLINEFGYFQMCKAIFTGDIVERMNILAQLKTEIDNVFSQPNSKNLPEKRKKLTIDDL